MSKIAGIFDPRRGKITPEDRRHLLRGFEMFPREEVHVFGGPGLLMAQVRDQHCIPASAGPIAWDGRLDNREDLLAQFPDTVPDCADASLVSKVFALANVEGLAKLIGDWSVAIWDEASNRVILASDYAGTRPLYYRYVAECLIWSSSLQHIVQWTGAEALDDEFAAGFLLRGTGGCRTPYSDIHAAPSGAAAVASIGRFKLHRYWQLAPPSDNQFGNEADYAQQLRLLFEDAVRTRMRTTGPVLSELSGGLDSSAIVCMAHQLIAQQRVATPELISVSYHHAGSQDAPYYRAVEQACNLRSMHLETSEFPFVAASSCGSAAPVWWSARHAGMRDRLHSCRSSVFLTGQMGDLVMGNWLDDSDQVADLMHRGSLARALSDAMAWSGVLHVPVYSILLRSLRLNLSSGAVPPSPGALHRFSDDSLLPAFKRRLPVTAFPQPCLDLARRVSPGKRKLFLSIAAILHDRALQVPEEMQPVFYSHPFSHRPLVEFMLAAPASIVCGPGHPRKLMRRAFQDLLPRAVIRRRSKAAFNAVFAAALQPLVVDLLEAPHRMLLAARGYIDARNLEVRLRRFLQGLDCNESQLRHIILLEYWLRDYQRRKTARTETEPLLMQV